MKRFISNICVLICLLFFGALGIDLGISKVLSDNKARMFVGWNIILKEHIDADLTILGSSRAWVHYDPYILDSILHINSYNLGIDGAHFLKQRMKYNIYKQYQELPQVVILNIDYLFSLEEETDYEREQLFPFFLYPSWRREIYNIRPSYSFSELNIPLFRYINSGGVSYFLHFIGEHNNLYKGYEGQELIWDGTNLRKESLRHVAYDEYVLQSLEQFVKEVKQDHVTLLFCFAPVYVGCTETVDNFKEIMDIYMDLSKKYDVPILDYTFSTLSQDTTYFYNATHMNKQGAELFSIQLAHDLDSLGIISH